MTYYLCKHGNPRSTCPGCAPDAPLLARIRSLETMLRRLSPDANAACESYEAEIARLNATIEKVRECCNRKMQHTEPFSEAELLCDDIFDIVGRKEVGDE